MSDIFTDQEQFMLAGGQTVGELNPEQMTLYRDLIKEEVIEYMNASRRDTNGEFAEPLENQCKELVDILIVVIGGLFSMGVKPNEAWDLVWQNNMAKVADKGNLVKDKNGKIMKSPESIARKAEMMDGIRALINKG